MLAFKKDVDGRVVAVADWKSVPAGERGGWFDRNDIKSFEEAEHVAAAAGKLSGRPHVACDRGEHFHPRYDVIPTPRVGDRVSRYYNGDGHPAGAIVSVSDSLRVVRTEDGTAFYRRGKSATWVAGGMWAMVPGDNTDRNPHI